MAHGLTVTPIWEYRNNSPSTPLPILKTYPADGPMDADFDALVWDSPQDSFGALKRFDDTRLLLAIRENGIVESDPKHDAALAAQYPDRSLIWISPVDGSPMGVALVVGRQPVKLDDDFLAAGGSTNDYYFNFGVSDDGVIFTGYANKILRYDPDGKGGFTGPKVVYTVPQQGAQWQQWRFEDIEVWGAGPNIQVLAGGKTWRDAMGYRHFVIADDGTLKLKYYIANVWADHANGGMSKPAIHGNGVDLVFPNEPVVYGNRYPGGDGGTGHIFNRWHLPAGADTIEEPVFEENFHQTVGWVRDDNYWAPERPDIEEAPKESAYRIEFCTDFDTANGLSYVIAYSAPSWNTPTANEGIYAPGWLAIHDASGAAEKDGAIISAYKLDTTEETEITYAEGITDWQGTMGEIDVFVPKNAGPNSCVIYWSGAIYGYGMFAVGSIPTGLGDWALY
jgi:hypothetical protein